MFGYIKNPRVKFLQITFIGCTILPYFLISSDNKSDQICFENCGPGRLRDFITVLSLSFHSIFEGLAVGLESTTGNVWKLFAGMKLDYSIGIRCYKFFLFRYLFDLFPKN